MKRGELLEMLLLQSREIDRLHKVIEDAKESSASATESTSERPSDAEIAKLVRAFVEQSKQLKDLRIKVKTLEEELENRDILISNAGSIAEASLRINKVFEAAQRAADQYLENVRKAALMPDTNMKVKQNGDASDESAVNHHRISAGE